MRNIWPLRKIFFVVLLFFAVSYVTYAQENQFKHLAYASTWPTSQAEIEYWVEGKRVGFIHYLKIPLLGDILYNFYIYPLYRGKGYGTELLLYACDVLKKQHAKRIFIQPGPFECGQDVITKYEECLSRLVKLYQGCGFRLVSSVTALGIRLLYAIIGVDEDARYLMVLFP